MSGQGEPGRSESGAALVSRLQAAAAIDPRDPEIESEIERQLATRPPEAAAFDDGPEGARAWIALGHALRAGGNRSAALAAFRMAARSERRNTGLSNEIGYLLRDLGRLDEAEAVFRGILEAEPLHDGARVGLAYVLRQRGDRAGALAGFEAALAAHPARIDLETELAHELRALHRLDEAEAAYRRILAKSSSQAARLGLALTLMGRKDQTGALAVFEAASVSDPGNLEVKNAIGYLLRDLRRHGEAEAVFREMLAASPSHAGALTGLGHVCDEQGRPADALRAFEALLALDPRNIPAHLQIASLLRRLDRLEEAEAMFRRVLSATPANPQALMGIAKLRKARGDRDGAVAAFTHALGLHPAHAGMRIEFAYLLRDIGRTEEAEAMLGSVSADEPRNGAALAALGWLMLDRFRLDEAQAFFERALGADARDVGCRLGLGHVARRRGDRADALAHFEAVLQVEPGHVDARLECAAEWRDRGAFAEARQIIDELLAERPGQVAVQIQLAQWHRRRGERHLALQVIEQVLAREPNHVAALLEAATEYWRLGRTDEAEDLVERALARDPTNLGALLQAADYAMAAEDFERAQAMAQRGLAAHPHRVWPYLQSARALVELGEAGEAQAVLARAERSCGNQPEIAATRIQLARHARDWPAARAASAVPAAMVRSSFFLWTEQILVALGTGDHAGAEAALGRAPATSTKDIARLHLFRAQLLEAQRRYDEAVASYREALDLDPEDGWGHGEMARACLLSLDLDAAARHLRLSVELDAATHRLRGQSLNISQHHLGQILDEFAFDREVLAELRAIRTRPQRDQIEPLSELVRRYPENTAPAVMLAIALRRAGLMPSLAGEGASPVPRRITQYWDGAEPPPDIARLMQSWRSCNPEYAYEIFSDAAARAFIMRRFPIDVVRAYLRARHPAQRADIFRLAYLGAEGGFYADADDRCLRPLDDFVPAGATLLLSQENYGTIGNNFIGATPGHPVVLRALALVTEAMNRGDADLLWLSTGPGLLTRAYAHAFAGLMPEAAEWRPHAVVREFADLQRDVACHCPARYKRTDRHWSRRPPMRSAVGGKRGELAGASI